MQCNFIKQRMIFVDEGVGLGFKQLVVAILCNMHSTVKITETEKQNLKDSPTLAVCLLTQACKQ
jgi:hypothetical protein